MKPIPLLLLCITLLSLFLVQTLAKDKDKDNDKDKDQDQTALSISPDEFITHSCESASDVEACHSIVGDIIGSNPRDTDLDAAKVAHETARQVQSRYGEVADDLQQLIKGNKDPKMKVALGDCYKMYQDIAHIMRETINHLKKENEVCKARDFAGIADLNPKVCEEALVKAGTTGEKLGLYKDYNDLQDLAGACDSIIGYMIQAKNYKTADCKKN